MPKDNSTKPWYYSKTIWANIAFLTVLFVGRIWGFEITTEETTAAIILINLVLRIFTGKGLTHETH